jgi:hypothetical protein
MYEPEIAQVPDPKSRFHNWLAIFAISVLKSTNMKACLFILQFSTSESQQTIEST